MLDAHGLPTLGRPAKGRDYLLAIGGLTYGMVSIAAAEVGLRSASPSVLGYPAWLAILSATLPSFLLAAPWNHAQFGRVGRGMILAGVVLGFIGFIAVTDIICPSCTG